MRTQNRQIKRCLLHSSIDISINSPRCPLSEYRKGVNDTSTARKNVPQSLNDYIEIMSKSVFRYGMSWKAIKSKWPEIREALRGFDAALKAVRKDFNFMGPMGIYIPIHGR